MENKKVYILTFHGSVNYGALFQAYALSKTVQQLGYDCEIIDYNRNTHHKRYLKILPGRMRYRAYQMMQWGAKYRLHRKFNRFLLEHCPLTPKSYDGFHVLREEEFQKDAIFLVGSDQVWNCGLTQNNMHYFLDFVSSPRKYSYASSFGIGVLPEEDKKPCKALLSQFQRITVREEQAACMVYDLLGSKPEVVCDPTFLLNREEWIALTEKKPDPYILLFLLSPNPVLVQQARLLAEKFRLPIYNINYGVTNLDGAKNRNSVSPEEWLSLIRNASFVVTDSFHGTALALNMEKEVFIGLTNLKTGSKNSRIVNMAQRYGMEHRIVTQAAVDEKNEIDYDAVRKRIDADRKKSLTILEEMLNGAK